MPDPKTTRKAKEKMKEGYAPTTAAGEFVEEEEIRHQKRRAHGAETRRQAIAIGLSKARRAGVPVRRPPRRSRRPGTGASGVSRRAARSRRGTASARRGARKAARTRARKRSR